MTKEEARQEILLINLRTTEALLMCWIQASLNTDPNAIAEMKQATEAYFMCQEAK